MMTYSDEAQQTWSLGECWLRLPLVTDGVLAGRHIHGWLQCWLLLELLEQLLAGLLAISPSILDTLAPANCRSLGFVVCGLPCSSY